MALNDRGLLETGDILERSSEGSLWISYLYIDEGHLDLVIADLKRDVTSRDFHGPLFANTRLVLERLLSVAENESVQSIYRAAIDHRLKAIRSEKAILRKSRRTNQAQKPSTKWLKHYIPPLKDMVADYEALLKQTNSSDPELENIKQTLRADDVS